MSTLIKQFFLTDTPEDEGDEVELETNTPTPEPSQTLTLTASPTVIVETDPIWEDDFSNHTRWYLADGDDFGFRYQDDGYKIYNNLLNASIWSLGYIGLNDIRIEIDAARVEGPDDGYFGVFCRHSDDGQNYYGLVIGDNGFYGIFKMAEGELDFIESGYDEDERIKLGEGETNHIEGACFGNKLSLFVNDQFLLEVTDDIHIAGGAGILAANKVSGTGIEVLFDNFAVYKE